MTYPWGDSPYPKKLLPFPWIFATRRTARRLIERVESLNRIITRQAEENIRLRSQISELERSAPGRARTGT